jgi:hypothetical protein
MDVRTAELTIILRELQILAERATAAGAPATAKEIFSATVAAILEGAKDIPDGDLPPRPTIAPARRGPAMGRR